MTDAPAELRNHNRPPPDLLTGDALRDKLRDENYELIMRRDELLAAAARVPEVTSDDVAGKVTDFVKQLAALGKAADAKRVGAKEPFLEGGRTVDGFFKAITDPVATAKTGVERKLTTYLRDKEARARREREEQERQAREAAEAARRDAEERAKAMRDQASLQAAVEAEKAAELAAADLVRAEQAATVKAAELSQTRGEYGSLSSLRTVWTFDGIDRAALDLEALRQHFPIDGLEKAIRSFIRAGGRELSGTRIYEETTAVVR
jgi:hypothetical protein